ncbi:MAG: hypothetical protein JWL85_305 [Candidatus Saccharibacteria bacterium]|nr:hypothetical protein [Candidatus Saccharibacteria bacterium]
MPETPDNHTSPEHASPDGWTHEAAPDQPEASRVSFRTAVLNGIKRVVSALRSRRGSESVESVQAEHEQPEAVPAPVSSVEDVSTGTFLEERGIPATHEAVQSYSIGPEGMLAFAELLSHYGVLAERPNEASIASGIEHARRVAEEGRVGTELVAKPFMATDTLRWIYGGDVRPIMVHMESELYANPDKLLSAETFDSWMGRGVRGEAEVAHRQKQNRPKSIEQITDYATRDTQLPPFDNLGLDLIMGDEGAFLVARNSHRAAAAKLRNEPLRFSSVAVYDMRTPNPE